MTKVIDHASRYPGARASTLVHLIEREKTTARLKSEVANFDHLDGVLIAELEQALADVPREQRTRIAETW